MFFRSKGLYWAVLVVIATLLTLEATLKAQDGSPAPAPAAADSGPARPAMGLSALSFLYTRAPQGLTFDGNGMPVTGSGTGWQAPAHYSSENKTVFYNGMKPASARDYIEISNGSNGDPSRYVMVGKRLRFSEFNVANIVGKNIASTTRCTSETDVTKMVCWTLDKPLCEGILKGAKVTTPDDLLAKLKGCIDLTSAVGKVDHALVDNAEKEFNLDTAAIFGAKDIGPYAKQAIKFQFDDPTKENGRPYLWLKYLAIASSCNAIMGLPTTHNNLDDIFQGADYQGGIEGQDGLPVRAFPGH